MNRKSFFRMTWVLTLLLAFSLGCKLVNQAQEMIALATDIDVKGLATDMDIEGLATDIDMERLATEMDLQGLATDIDVQGLATNVDLDEMATQMAPVMTQMGSLLTDMPGLDGTLVAASTPSGFPDDVPVIDGQKFNMTGSSTQLEYSVDTDFTNAVDYYRREMAVRGWAEGSSRVEEDTANLVFQKGNRQANVEIGEDFLFGLAIKITITG